jgi:hypothetical protein
LVAPIMNDVTATARAPATKRRDSKCGERAKSLVMQTPTVEAMTCEMIALRGCERGDVRTEKLRIAAAPYLLLADLQNQNSYMCVNRTYQTTNNDRGPIGLQSRTHKHSFDHQQTYESTQGSP